MSSVSIDTDTPRAWVGCLGCYNGGTLNGLWVDGSTAADIVATNLATVESVGDYTAPRCRRCFSDEFWVFEHENYGGLIAGECSPNEAQAAAELLESIPESEREAFREYAAFIGKDYANYDDFIDAYSGQYDTAEDFARELLEGTGELNGDSLLSRYFDYESYTRDLFYDYTITDSGHVFRSC